MVWKDTLDLTLSELANLLKVSRKTIYRWVHAKELPAYRIHHQFRFKDSEIKAWLEKKKIVIHPQPSAELLNGPPFTLDMLLKNGGIYYKVEGDSPREAIKNAIDIISLPPEVQRDALLEALLFRESLTTTAIGNGVAIPHTRDPIQISPENQSLNICFLQNPVDFDALDGKAINVMIIPLCSNLKNHLEVYAKISHLCQNRRFLSLLDAQSGRKEIMDFLETFEP